jgi:hypothetical protein
MKRIAILGFLMTTIAVRVLMAQYSQITIFHQDGERFWVIIDGIKQNAQPQASVFLPEVKQDFLRVKIIFENEKIKDIDQNIQTRDLDGNYTHAKYIIKPMKKKTVMRAHSYEVIKPVETTTQTQPAVEPKQAETVTETTQPVNTTTTTTTTTQTVDTKPTTETIGVGVQVIDPVTGQPVGMDVSIKVPTTETGDVEMSTSTKTPDGNFSTSTQVTTTQTTVTTTQTIKEPQITTATVQPVEKQPATTVTPADKPNVYQMPGYNGKIGCPWPMSEQDFASAKQSISSKSFEDSKLTIAKQITSSNCLLCSQINEIMGLFSFEDSRLDFAKFAYDYVYDMNNYYKLNDAFSFESSIEELDEYVRAKGK